MSPVSVHVPSVQQMHAALYPHPQSRHRIVPSPGNSPELRIVASPSPTSPQPLTPTELFSVCLVLPFPYCLINGISQWGAFPTISFFSVCLDWDSNKVHSCNWLLCLLSLFDPFSVISFFPLDICLWNMHTFKVWALRAPALSCIQERKVTFDQRHLPYCLTDTGISGRCCGDLSAASVPQACS